MATRNIVPRANNEGGVGTTSKKWGNIWSTLVNALTLTAQATGFTIAGGTTSKTLTVDETATLSAKANLASPTFTGTPAAPAPSDNTSTTQLATTAYAKSQDAVLARLPDQAVNMTAATSGSSGIAVADNANIDFGTGDFTLVWRGSLPDWTPGGQLALFNKGDATAGWRIFVETTGLFTLIAKNGSATVFQSTSTAANTFSNNSSHEITIAVVRETATTAGSVTFYIDGVLLGDSVSITAATTLSLYRAIGLYLLGISAVRTAGTCSFAATYNRALTAAEVLDLYRNGIAYADKWGSQTAIYASDFSAGVDGWVGDATTLVGNVDSVAAINDTLRITVSITYGYHFAYKSTILTIGKKYRVKASYYIPSTNSNCNGVSFGDGVFWLDTQTTLDAWTDYVAEYTAQGTFFGALLKSNTNGIFQDSGGDDVVYLKLISCTEIGATLALEPEGIQPAPGQWHDSSTNKLHAMQPATGSSLVRKKDTFEVRWTNTWAGTHEAQYIGGVNQSVLPVGCYIEEIVGVVTGATPHDIIIGDGSDTDRWVTITTGLAAGTTSFTIANRISDGTNYKLVVDPDTNATMSIAWTIKGRILQ